MKKQYLVILLLSCIGIVLAGGSWFWSEKRTIQILEPIKPLDLSVGTTQEPGDISPGETTSWKVSVTSKETETRILSATVSIQPGSMGQYIDPELYLDNIPWSSGSLSLDGGKTVEIEVRIEVLPTAQPGQFDLNLTLTCT